MTLRANHFVWIVFLGCGAGTGWSDPAHAANPVPQVYAPASKLWGRQVHCVDEFQRTGQSSCVAWYARPTKTCDYRGYYVGGGAAIGGEGRGRDEGTWGWDYVGRRFQRLVAQDWWHHHRPCTNRAASYETDGPKVIPPE